MTTLPEACIHITLSVADDRVTAVTIHSSRLTGAPDLLAGRHAAEVLRLLPAVFSLCGTAQAVACLEAVEQAAGCEIDDNHRKARRLLLAAETIGEHGLAIARDWPPLIDQPADLGTAKRLRTALASLRRQLYPDGDWAAPGGGRLAPEHSAVVAALGQAGDALAVLDQPADRLREAMETAGLAGFGTSPIPLMPAGGPPDLGERLRADADGSYRAHPDCAGAVFETGPLARHSDLAAARGNDVIARLAARRTDLAQALAEANRLANEVAAAPPGGPCSGSGHGLATVEAARGLLAHRVELDRGVVTRLQILAPTEWNFHPEGPLARGLAGTTTTTGDLRWRALILAHALDPCVAFSVRVEPSIAR